MRRTLSLGVICAIAFGAGLAGRGIDAAQQAGAARDARPPAPPLAGTGVIAGTVTAGDSGRPVRRVRVTLENEPGRPVAVTATDQDGRFTFGRLPAGSFNLKAARAGFLEVIYGQKKAGSGRPGTPIHLADAQKIDKIGLVLPRGGVLFGVVTDEVGDPVSGVSMRAHRFQMRNGIREPVMVATLPVTSDDRGQYRLFGLPPGEYVVCAAPRDELLQAAAQAESLRRRVEEIQAAAAARGGADPEARAMADRMAASPSPEAPKDAYVPVCAPGTTQTTQAATVTLDVGEERPGGDIRLQLVPITRVAGTVVWSGGQMPIGNSASDTHVVLTAAQTLPGSSMNVLHVPANGRFSFLNVAAGQYNLTVRAIVSRPPAAAGEQPGRLALWASADITVSGDPVSDLVLSLEPGMTVSGRVVAEGTIPIDLTRLRITALVADLMAGETAPVVASPDAEGRFTLEGVVPGRYRIGAYPSSPGAANFKSSVFNGRDTLDFPIEVKPGEPLTNGVITVVPRLAEITGQLQHDANQPATGFTVIVFTADQRYWTPQSRRVQGLRPATDGRFSFRNLPAGEYRLVAVTDVEAGQWFDPAFLKELVAASMSLTLSDGERREQSLRVVR